MSGNDLERKQRGWEVAERTSRIGGARFLAHGKPVRFGDEGVEYEALLVRKSDKDRSLRLLAINEETTNDLALVLDVLLAQSRILAEQRTEIDRLAAEVSALREERIATDVTREVNTALLQAGKEGVSVDGFEFEISTEQLDDELATRSRSIRDVQDRAKNESWSANASLGGVAGALASANLAANGSDKTAQYINALEETATHRTKRSERRFSGKLKVARVEASRR